MALEPGPPTLVTEASTSSATAAPSTSETKVESPVVEPAPAFSKVIEFTPVPETARSPEPIAADREKIVEGHQPESVNGHPEEGLEATTKPFNFVKKWFVSRTGG